MNYRIIRNDILKSKLVSFTTMVFVMVAALLIALAAILGVNLSGAIDTLMLNGKTPHYLQMHSGAIDVDRLQKFANDKDYIDDFQVIEFLNVDGYKIVFENTTLGGSLTDNGFSTQSNQFDYVLDIDSNIIDAADGELYVPLCYKKDGSTQVGERAYINGKEFVVAGFLRDSQMNSTLAASKRFIVSENDYATLKEAGSVEYLIEFRLKDMSMLGKLETDYTAAGLESNGPAVTYSLIKTINAISDGMMIGVIFLISMLVVAITFMCIRFTLLAKIEEEYREIGVMKAIGLPLSQIKKIYFLKYAAISAVGCMMGFVLSLLLKDRLLVNIRLYMGGSENEGLALLIGLTGIFLVFAAILCYVSGVLSRFKKISVTSAIRFGISTEQAKGAKKLRLHKSKLFSPNVFLGVKDVLSRKKLYVTMLLVVVLAVFIMIVPQNLYNTISSKDFITYMGVGNCDLRIDIQQTEDIPAKLEEIVQTVAADIEVERYASTTTKQFYVDTDNGGVESIRIELGNHLMFPVEYSEGSAPKTEHEIALSVINADGLGKQVGDKIRLTESRRVLTVCGIYSDITNGGKTAQAMFEEKNAAIMKSVVTMKLKDYSQVESVSDRYSKEFSYAKVASIEEYMKQFYGQTIESIQSASYVAIIVAILITLLVTLLFMKMLIAKDAYSIAVIKSCGYTNRDISKQYITRAGFVLAIGIVVGTILSNTLGKLLAQMIISSFGASSFKFIVNPLTAYIGCPLIMICVVYVATILSTKNAGKLKISEHIKE